LSNQSSSPSLIFLSHSAEDSAAARDLARELERSGFSVWLDLERLSPGEDWLDAIEAALREAAIFAVYVGRPGVRRWVDREVKAALIRSVDDPQFRIVPILGAGARPADLSLILRQYQWLDLRQAALGPAELRTSLQSLLGTPARPSSVLPPDQPPFKGLETFQPEDSLLFFGRDRETECLLDGVRNGRFLAVIGDSGSGKSSLVRAGLLPALRHIQPLGQPAPSRRAAIMRPGDDPFRELANAILDLIPESDPVERLRIRDQCSALLAQGKEGLNDCAGALVPPHHPTLLVVDQFEELFTQTRDALSRQRFVDTLLAAVAAEGDRPISVLITLRADFYAHLWHHRRLLEQVAAHQFPLSRPQSDQLGEMIEGPLRLTGCRLEPGLAASILSELGDEPGGLPLLEHALLELWRRRRGVELTHEAYEELGRLKGAIQNHAEAIYLGMDPASQEIARRIFVALTSLAEEPAKDTRRRIKKSDILDLSDDQALTSAVVERLAAGRLITTGRDDLLGQERVELAHEVLLRGWSRLRGWLDSDRADELLRRRISTDAAEWAPRRDAAALYRGSRLDAVREWSTRHGSELGNLEQAFIAASIKAKDDEQRREDEQRQRGLLITRRVRLLAVALGLSALAAMSAALLALSALRQARSQAHEAESRALAARSLASLQGDALRALLLAISAAREAPTPEAANALRSATASARMRFELRPVNQVAHPVGFSRNGGKVLTIFDGVTVWDTTSGKRLALLKESLVVSADLSPNGRQVVTGGSGVHLWDAETGKQLRSLSGTTSTVTSVAFAQSGRRIVASGMDGSANLWDLEANKVLHFEGGVESSNDAATAFDPTSNTIVTPSATGVPQLWDAASGKQLRRQSQEMAVECPGTSPRVPAPRQGRPPVWRHITRSPDGRWAVTKDGSEADQVKIWDVFTGRLVHCLSTLPSFIVDVAFSPDGARVLTGSRDDTIRLWDTASARQLMLLRPRSSAIRQVFFARAAPTFGLLDHAGSVFLWPQGERDQLFVLHSGEDPIVSLALSPDGRKLLTRGYGRVARLFDVSSKIEPLALSFHASVSPRYVSYPLHFSSDGHRLYAGFQDKSVYIVELPSGREMAHLTGFRGTFLSDSLSQDDALALTIDAKAGTLWLWDLRTARLTAQLRFPGRQLQSAFFVRGPLVVATGDAQDAKALLRDQSPLTCLWDATGKPRRLFHRELMSTSDDGRAVTRASDGRVWITDLASGRDLLELQRPGTSRGFERALLSSDGKLLLTWYAPTLWDAQTGRVLATFHEQSGIQLLTARISDDDKSLFMVTIGPDVRTSAEIWSLIDYKRKVHIASSVGTGFVFGRVSPDSRQFVTSGGLGSTSANLWDSASGAALGSLPCPWGSGDCFADFSPDGRWILTRTDGASTIFVHTARLGDLLRKAESLVPKYLTSDDRKRLMEPGQISDRRLAVPVE
jgi:WD40 repeat protein